MNREIPTQAPEPTLVHYNNPLIIKTPEDQPKQSGMEALLSKMLPERIWIDRGACKIQYVSSTPATRAEVKLVGRRLNEELKSQDAHSVGICRVRSRLHEQCFDEIIRQVTITCAARGTLLNRIHEEIRRRIKNYETLYESANAYGLRSCLRGGGRKDDMLSRIKVLEKTNLELEVKIEQEMQQRALVQKSFEASYETIIADHEAYKASEKDRYNALMHTYTEKIKVASFDKTKTKTKLRPISSSGPTVIKE